MNHCLSKDRASDLLRASVLALGLLFLLGCPDVRQFVPSELRGEWTAAGDLYEGRVMTFERDKVTFDAGLGEASTYPVLGVLVERKPDETHYALDYVMENGGEYRLRLVYDRQERQLRLAGRRQVVWSREKT